MFRFSIHWPAALLLAAAPASWFGGCEQQNEFQPPPPPEVTVAQPVERPVVDTVQFTGTTRATATVDLRARVNGYLKEIHFEDGDTVEKGDLLFVIDPAPFEVERLLAEANLEKAKAELKLAESELRRVERLHQRGAATQSEYDIQKAEYATAQAEVDAADAALQQAKLQLGYTKILAPIGGRIGRHLVDEGNLVLAEQTLLATIESIEPIHAYFHVSEQELLGFMEMLRRNELPDPEKDPPTLYLGLANEEGYPHKGELDFRELGVDPSTGTVLRRGVFPNRDHELIPGLFVRIQAEVGSAEPRMLVEERAISSDQRGSFLLVVNDENKVERRPVELGISVGGMRVIREGIQKTDWVVINGLQRARPQAPVRPVKVKMATPESTDPADFEPTDDEVAAE